MDRVCAAITIFFCSVYATSAPAAILQIVDNIPGTFLDISKTSSPRSLADDGETVVATSIGNDVFPAGSIVVANNGGVGFRSPPSNELSPVNEPIPSANAFGGGQAALVFWDDIDDKNGDVYVDQGPSGLIIQWHQQILTENPIATVTFQMRIFTPEEVALTGIVAQYVFSDITQVGGGASATIGYQDGGAGFGDFQLSFDTAGAVASGTVLSLTIPEPATVAFLAIGSTFVLRRRGGRRTCYSA